MSEGLFSATSPAHDLSLHPAPGALAVVDGRLSIRDYGALVNGGPRTRLERNLLAVETLKELDGDGREPTIEELGLLASYVGWGGLSQAFAGWTHSNGLGGERDQPRIEALLGPEAYAAARASTLNAHYTPPELIHALYAALRRQGFAGGRLLEPGCGVGNFIGLMPEDLRAVTDVIGVEVDPTSAAIAQRLYSEAKILQRGFETVVLPDGYFDAVVGNVPFATHGVHEPRYGRSKLALHDHFIVKSLDLLKPGGALAVVTATSTMDKANPRARLEMYRRADLVGAFRLPAGCFQANAGTETCADVLIFRRIPGMRPLSDRHRAAAELDDADVKDFDPTDLLDELPNWLSVDDHGEFDGSSVNRYFLDHEEAVLGAFQMGSGPFGQALTVRSDANLTETGARLAEMVGDLSIDTATATIGRATQVVLPAEIAAVPVPDGLRDGRLFALDEAGQTRLYRYAAGVTYDLTAEVPAAHLPVFLAATGVRDALQEVFRCQIQGAAVEIRDEARRQLTESYDGFVAAHGQFRSRAVAQVLADDPDHPLLCALEIDQAQDASDPARRLKGRSRGYAKAPVFFRDTLVPGRAASGAATPAEAIAQSLDERGQVDLDFIAAALGRGGFVQADGKSPDTHDDVLKACGDLIFIDPESSRPLSADEYLTGEVKRKLKAAREMTAVLPEFARNVTALEEVQPAPIPYPDIDARLGSSWIPPADIVTFLGELLDGDAADVKFNPSLGQWRVQLTWPKAAPAVLQWGTSRLNAGDLVERCLNGAPIMVRDVVRDGETTRSVLNEEETLAAQTKAGELRERFREWLWDDAGRRERLAQTYNDLFNDRRIRKFDGTHLSLPGMSPEWSLRVRQHQKDFTWRVLTTGRGLAAHEVGTGKTLTFTMCAMEARRTGLARKPVIAVKKSNLEQVARDFREYYPAANILVMPTRVDKAERERLLNLIVTGDWDAVIISHDSLDRIPMTPSTEMGFVREQMGEFRAILADMEAEDQRAGRKKSRTVKQTEKALKKLQVRLKTLLDTPRANGVIYFEDMGLDLLIVDEAHRYKNLFILTAKQGLKGIPTAASKRAAQFLMRCTFLMGKSLEATGRPRGVVLATGTPVANTVAEVFTLMRYLQPETLDQRGIQSFDGWAGTFAEVVNRVEMAVTGQYRMTARMSRFVNLPELALLASETIDVVKAMDVGGIVRPAVHGHVVSAPPTAAQLDLMASLADRAQNLRMRGSDNMLKISSDGRKAALDMRLVDGDADDDPESKVNQCVDGVIRIWRDNPGRTQMIFLDIGINGGPPPLPLALWSSDPDDEDGAAPTPAADGDDPSDDAPSSTGQDAAILALDAGSTTGFSVREDIKRKLAAAGIPDDQVLDFCGDMNDQERLDAIGRLDRGEAAVAIGSTEKLGTGVNAQSFLIALHHLDAPWLPAFVDQRDGRGVRHGNLNEDIWVYRYVTERSFDGFMWQVLDTKSGFIRQFLEAVSGRHAIGREIRDDDGSELSAAQVMAVATGNPFILLKVQLEDEVRVLDGRKRRHERDVAEARYGLDQAHGEIKSKTASLTGLTVLGQASLRAFEVWDALPGGEKEAEKAKNGPLTLPLVFELAGAKIGASRVGIAEGIQAAANRLAIEGSRRPSEDVSGTVLTIRRTGSVGEDGVEFRIVGDVSRAGWAGVRIALTLEHPPSRTSQEFRIAGGEQGIRAAMKGAFRNGISAHEAANDAIAAAQLRIATCEVVAEKPFGHAAELADRTARLGRILRILSLPAPEPQLARQYSELPGVDFAMAEANVERLYGLAVSAESDEKDRLLREASAWQAVALARDPETIAAEESRHRVVTFPTATTARLRSRPVHLVEADSSPPAAVDGGILTTIDRRDPSSSPTPRTRSDVKERTAPAGEPMDKAPIVPPLSSDIGAVIRQMTEGQRHHRWQINGRRLGPVAAAEVAARMMAITYEPPPPIEPPTVYRRDSVLKVSIGERRRPKPAMG